MKQKSEVRGQRLEARKIGAPRDVLFRHQLAWIADRSRFKLGLWARQTGKDFTSSGEAAEDCCLRTAPDGAIIGPRHDPTQWIILATGERQALESVAQARVWTEAYNFAIREIVDDREHSEALLRSVEIVFANGSRLRALPANPKTCRGFSANLILTEFAFHEQPDEIWRAIYPSITNPLRGGEKKLRIISTPNGRGNKFADLWFRNWQQPGAQYACHRVTIHDAVAAGMPLDAAELRASLDDPEGWAQEYECEFIDSAAILLPYELLAQGESPEATEVIAPEYWEVTPTAPRYLGIDFGRKRDLTVCWTMEPVGDVLHTREVLELARQPTPEQIERLRPRIARAARVCLDYTGPGIGLGDFLVKEFQEWNPERHLFGKIELCNFSNALKTEVFPKLRMAFEARRVRVPVSRAVREDLHSVHRRVTPGGAVTYAAPHTADGHADRCTALALAVRAAALGAGACGVSRRQWGAAADQAEPRAAARERAIPNRARRIAA